jgi:hypothetical protein
VVCFFSITHILCELCCLLVLDDARAALTKRHVVASLVNVLKSNEDTIKSTVANIMLEIMKHGTSFSALSSA